ncbi:TetR/AcrR family transcriptional regulator [Phormidium sp. LEGE 05292]|uniref:TetR/AcrR family transcriptional regulator n=1 Tax=[Phormidium] sp. LEGE 05292 TaxID=767427 RepID=UPI00187F7A7B|nr:TetR/AcrR family transcriptional regulator [Phormidium sp. LEGE 05292]MBE9227541.1 TetR/AcrR family transcriptional regulator [Phormidium sp. LEGE 05292]
MPKIVDHDVYRRELLNKCFDLFAEKGYGSITMRQIADGLGVSTGTLYHYFPSKKALYEQLVEEINRQDLLKVAAELEGTQTLQERIEACGRFLKKNEDYFIKQTFIMMDFCQNNDPQEIKSNPVIKLTIERSLQAICELLDFDDRALAAFIMTHIDGLLLQRIWLKEEISISEQFVILGEMIAMYLDKKKLCYEEKP